MFHEGRFFTCCGMQLRTTPVKTQVQSNDEKNSKTGDALTNGCHQRRRYTCNGNRIMERV